MVDLLGDGRWKMEERMDGWMRSWGFRQGWKRERERDTGGITCRGMDRKRRNGPEEAKEDRERDGFPDFFFSVHVVFFFRNIVCFHRSYYCSMVLLLLVRFLV